MNVSATCSDANKIFHLFFRDGHVPFLNLGESESCQNLWRNGWKNLLQTHEEVAKESFCLRCYHDWLSPSLACSSL